MWLFVCLVNCFWNECIYALFVRLCIYVAILLVDLVVLFCMGLVACLLCFL